MPVLSLPVPERFGSRFTVRFLSHTESKWDAMAVELVSFMGGTKGYQGI